ncbi:MAG: hypothetical protein ABJB47_02770 [Actinomycetota bacterium]
MRPILGSVLFPAVLAALLWIIISFATGGTALFSIVGGIAVGVVAFVISYGFHRYYRDRKHPVA